MKTTRPNIILILADDMGYGDVTCYDPQHNRVPTPCIDALASQGMSFTNAHTASSLCTPSRYSLLTGRYAWRTHLQRGVLMEWAKPLIDENRLTVASMLRAEGYRTACVGKWHLGLQWPGGAEGIDTRHPVGGGPLERGFDHYFGIDVPNFPPYAWIDGDRIRGTIDTFYDRDPAMVLKHPGMGVADWRFDTVLETITRDAVDRIDAWAPEPEPFFLYFSLTTPHEPVAPGPRFKGKSGISGVADLIMETDWAVGQIMQALEAHGIADNTLLIFTTDNGHCPYTDLAPFERVGHRVSGPLRGYKGDIWEGGHRVPFVARWPQVVPAGSRCHQLLSLADFLATSAAITGAQVPANGGEDSFNALPLLAGEDRPIRQSAVFHSAKGRFAIFRDGWKLSLCPDSGGNWNPEKLPPDLPSVQLQHLDADIAEQHNLHEQHPALVRDLTAELEKIVAQGRSNLGPPLANDVAVDIFKAG